MTMVTIPLEHSVFAARLTEHIMTRHPEKMMDNAFITERAVQAAKAFENASFTGMSVEESMNEANRTLFQGLLFSPYMMVREVVLNELDYHEDDEELDEFTMQMLDMVTPVIQTHQPNDDFQGSQEYAVLYDEIKDTINQYLIRNGIQ